MLTPAQLRVVEDLLAPGGPRPHFAAGLPLRLLDALERELTPVAERLGPAELTVTKSALSQVHQCERHHLAEAEASFAWSTATARGTVAHKALELSVFLAGEAAPMQLADLALERLREGDDDWGPRSFLLDASAAELAELRSDVSDLVAKFQECFPPLQRAWRPRLESRARVELCAGRIVLRSKVDLALGRAVGTEARVLIVDFKTGQAHRAHLDDLRYYALVECLRMGVPPFRIATYYLDSARWQHEDVTEDVLETAARRVVAGVTTLAELRLGERAPTLSPGPSCSYCRLRAACPAGREWARGG